MQNHAKFLALATLLGCGGGSGPLTDDDWDNLAPVENPNPAGDREPTRKHPYAAAMTSNGQTAFVTLRGSEAQPASEVAVIDVFARKASKTLTVGDRPVAIALRPAEDYAVVLSHFSPYAAVIDVGSEQVVSRIEVGYYAEELAFSADGQTMYVSNRASDEIQRWNLSTYRGLSGELVASSPAGNNPGAVALSPDGNKVYVADAGGLGIRVFDAGSLEPIANVHLNAPVFDIEAMGSWVVATTLNETNGLPCEQDGDYIGTQGDGIMPIVTDRTCGRGFSDLQNEIAFIDPANDTVAIRYTSDSADTSEADREGDYDPQLMQVVGSLPHSIAVVSDTVAYVTMGASDQIAEMVIDGASPPTMTMPRTWDTGFTPRGIGVAGDGSVILSANMLGESITVVDVGEDRAVESVIGENSPAFPATSAEIGELYFNSAKYASDGDQSCAHCHPDGDTDGKAWGVEVVRAFGRRATIPTRNLFETRPLLVEGVFDETDFNLEMEGISFRPDFHDSSYTLQLERRDEFYRTTSRALIEREVGFNDMVGHIADYLMIEPRLLPSPFDKATPEVERGEAIFRRPDVACAACHPEPTFASPDLFEGITTLGRYDRPRRNLDPDVSVKYIENARDGFFNANSLRGLWDRRGSLLHDGRARTIRESIMTPQHPCLHEGELAFNEFSGQVDTNGGISHLTCEQIDDLLAFLKTID